MLKKYTSFLNIINKLKGGVFKMKTRCAGIVLFEEGIESCDAFIALTSIDEENIVYSRERPC